MGLFGLKKEHEKSPLKCYIAAASMILILLGLTFVIYGSIDYKTDGVVQQVTNRVGVVVDAGGSGTRLIVYSYANRTMKQVKYLECEPRGLTNYNESQLVELRRFLDDCLMDGVSSLRNMTGKVHKKVPIYFAATAGMRLLRLRNKQEYDRVWSLVNERLAASDFIVAKAATITGFEEAEWAWVTANYLKHTFGTGKTKHGTLDFGSSSLQIAFVPDDATKSSPDTRTIDIDGDRVNLYSHSYLCYGSHEMTRRFLAKLVKQKNYVDVIDNPCFFDGYTNTFNSDYLWKQPCSTGDYAKNYLGEELSGPPNKEFTIRGTGNFTECSRLVSNLLDRQCNHTAIGCGLNGEYQPNINGHFFAMSSFYYISKSMNLPSGTGREGYLRNARTLCANKWSKVTRGMTNTKYADGRCFMATYGFYLLDAGFKFNKSSWNIDYAKKIKGVDIGWSLGLMYSHKDSMYATHVEWVRRVVVRPVMLVLIVVGPISIGVGLLLLFSPRICKGKETKDPEAEGLNCEESSDKLL